MEGCLGVGADFWANTAQSAQNKKDGAKCEPWRYCLYDFITEPVRYHLSSMLKKCQIETLPMNASWATNIILDIDAQTYTELWAVKI